MFTTLETFDESKHPRGQPENAGEFAAVNGGVGEKHKWSSLADLNEKSAGRVKITPFKYEFDKSNPANEWNSDSDGGFVKGQTNTEGKMSLAKLHTIQNIVNKSGVGEYFKHPEEGNQIDIVVHDGKPYLVDGNHRSVAAYLHGETHIDAKFWQHDKQSNKFVPYTGDIGKFE